MSLWVRLCSMMCTSRTLHGRMWKCLKGISFALHPGTVTALVGPSGQGKSTVVSLIERWYDLQDDGAHGSITIDGRPIRSLPLLHLHRHIGLVSQNPVLFATTIRENLLYGCRPSQSSVDESDEEIASVSDEALQRACEMANAWQFIQSFPDKLDTLVGERGVRLSGGQLQRIAIARAILLNPRVLIAGRGDEQLGRGGQLTHNHHTSHNITAHHITSTALPIAIVSLTPSVTLPPPTRPHLTQCLSPIFAVLSPLYRASTTCSRRWTG